MKIEKTRAHTPESINSKGIGKVFPFTITAIASSIAVQDDRDPPLKLFYIFVYIGKLCTFDETTEKNEPDRPRRTHCNKTSVGPLPN